MRRFLLCSALVFSVVPVASAQEFELDLSEPDVPKEFKASIAVLGVTPTDTPEDPNVVTRAKLVETELLKYAQANTSFAKVLTPGDVATALGAGAADARKCVDFACLDAIAKKLQVERLVFGQLAKAGPGTLLTVFGFDPVLGDVPRAEIESDEKNEKKAQGGFAGLQGKSQAQKDKDFVKKLGPTFYEVFKKLGTPNGKLSIDTAEPTAVTTINGVERGTGSFELTLQRGSYEVKTNAPEYKPFEQTITVEPQKTATVKVLLVAKPIERKVPAAALVETSKPFYKRPGLYVAVAGVAVVAAGIAMGVSAKGVESQALKGQMPSPGLEVPITRAQAQAAKSQATIASVLMGVGAAVAAGGVVWFVLTPPAQAAAGPQEASPADAAPTPGGGFGFMIGTGGTF